MSLAALERVTLDLPPKLRDDIMGYARSVQAALPDIFGDARVARTERLADEIVFIAGVKKLYAICSSNYWILDNSLHALANRAEGVRLGSTVIRRGSPYFQKLHALDTDLRHILATHGLFEFIEIGSYSEILRRIARER